MNNRTSRGFVSSGFEKMDFNHIDEGVQKGDIVLSPFSIEREDECDSSDMLHPLLVFSTCDDGCLYLCGGIASYYAYRKYARGRSMIVHTRLEVLSNYHEVAVLTNVLESNTRRYLPEFKNGHPAIRRYAALDPFDKFVERNDSRGLCAVVATLIHGASGEDISRAGINKLPYRLEFDERETDILFGRWMYACRILNTDTMAWVRANAYITCCMIITLSKGGNVQALARSIEVMYEMRKGLFYDEKGACVQPFARGVDLINTITAYLQCDAAPQPIPAAFVRKLPLHTSNMLVKTLLGKPVQREYMLRHFQENISKYGDVI